MIERTQENTNHDTNVDSWLLKNLRSDACLWLNAT